MLLGHIHWGIFNSLSFGHYQIRFYEASLGGYNWLDPCLGSILSQHRLYLLCDPIVLGRSGILSYFTDLKYAIEGFFCVAGPITH